MWNGKNKAITFSFDDGVTQDIKLIEIFNKYGLKATFNLNSSLLGVKETLNRNGHFVFHNKIEVCDVKKVYEGHEIACHTLTHPYLPSLEEEIIIYQVEEDRKRLSDIAGYEVVGMAYPCGGENNDERVANTIKNHTGVKYARTIASTYRYSAQENLYRFNPTIDCIDKKLESIVDDFLDIQADKPQLLYIWGHSFELDAGYISWEQFEKVCQKLSGKTNIFYGTNKDVLLG